MVIDNCFLEAQQTGKSPQLCAADSAFNALKTGCQSCVTRHGQESDYPEIIEPQFQQFIAFCSGSQLGPTASGGRQGPQSQLIQGISAGPAEPAAPPLETTSVDGGGTGLTGQETTSAGSSRTAVAAPTDTDTSAPSSNNLSDGSLGTSTSTTSGGPSGTATGAVGGETQEAFTSATADPVGLTDGSSSPTSPTEASGFASGSDSGFTSPTNTTSSTFALATSNNGQAVTPTFLSLIAATILSVLFSLSY